MKTLKSDPQAVYLSGLIYRSLLFAYPKEFQLEFASSMAQVFHDCCLRAFHLGGLNGMVSLWSLTLTDYVKSVFEEHWGKGVKMNTPRFIRLSGWALIIGTVAFLADVITEKLGSGRLISFDPNNYYSRPIDQVLLVLPYILVPSAMLLLTIGMIGVYKLYAPKASLPAKVGLVAGIAGGALAFATCMTPYGTGALTYFLRSNRFGGLWLWNLAALGLFLLFGGFFIFGIDAIKRQLLPRWNFIPILAGALIPVRILLAYLQEATTKGWSHQWKLDITMVDPPMLILTAIGLITLGYFLKAKAPQEEQLGMGNPGLIG
jgi:hypothetical protein